MRTPLWPGPLVRSLEWRPLALIGVASYSLYLWRLPILLALDRARWAPSDFLGLLAIGLQARGTAEGNILGPADGSGKAGANENSLPGREDDR
jgi:hypothetical protein